MKSGVRSLSRNVRNGSRLMVRGTRSSPAFHTSIQFAALWWIRCTTYYLVWRSIPLIVRAQNDYSLQHICRYRENSMVWSMDQEFCHPCFDRPNSTRIRYNSAVLEYGKLFFSRLGTNLTEHSLKHLFGLANYRPELASLWVEV